MAEEQSFELLPECGQSISLSWAADFLRSLIKPADYKFWFMCVHLEADGKRTYHQVKATQEELNAKVKAYPNAKNYYDL